MKQTAFWREKGRRV